MGESEHEKRPGGAEDPDTRASFTKTTVTGVFWLSFGRLLRSPVNLIVTAILARLLSPSDFGIIAIAYTVQGLANILVDGSFGMVLVQKKEVRPPEIGASVLLSSLLGAFFGLLIMASAPAMQNFFHFVHLTTVMRLMGVILPISAAGAVWSALLQRGSQFRVLTINSAIAQIASATTAISMAFMGFGIWSLVWSQVVGTTVESFLGFLAARRRYRVEFSRMAINEVLRSGGMFTLAKLFNWGAGNIDRIVIGRLLGAAPLGFYSRGATLMMTFNQLIGAGAMRVLFSTFSRMQHDRTRLLKAFDRAISTAMIGSALTSAFVVMFADLVVRVTLGHKWLAAIPVIQILFSAFVTRSGYVVAEAVPLALGLSRASALRQGAHFVLVVTGAAIGSQFGIIGAAIGVATGYWLFYLLCLVLVWQLLDIGVGRLVRVHVNGALIAAGPVLATLAFDWLTGHPSNLLARAAAAMVFCATAAAVLAVAPESVVSEDMAKARRRVFELAGERLPALRLAKSR